MFTYENVTCEDSDFLVVGFFPTEEEAEKIIPDEDDNDNNLRVEHLADAPGDKWAVLQPRRYWLVESSDNHSDFTSGLTLEEAQDEADTFLACLSKRELDGLNVWLLEYERIYDERTMQTNGYHSTGKQKNIVDADEQSAD